MRGGRISAAAGILAAVATAACTNNPYPDRDAELPILYVAFREAPKTLDPAKAYTTVATQFNGNIYDRLLEYHFLKRPYTLIPALAAEVPSAVPLPDGRVAYDFELRPDLLFQDDPCFALGGDGRATRQVTAQDVVFQLQRVADPALASPVITAFGNIEGLLGFFERLGALREEDPGLAELPIRDQYARAGPIEGLVVEGDTRLRVILSAPYPQILYWFAMPFSAPVPWEAIDYYDGQEGRPHFADHPVGTGPYKMTYYDKQARVVLEANPNWYGVRHPEWKAPGATYPSEGMPEDAELGRLDPELVGQPLPFIQRIDFRREKESIPRFNKFLQGYYDMSRIIKESFDSVIHEDDLSPAMRAMGVRLETLVEPSVFYIGFNMEDDVVGAGGGARSRKLRQAMSLTIDSAEFVKLFYNGRGVPAQSPLPPGIFGYDPEYRNPYRQVDLGRAAALLVEAGYPGGLDPATGKPLSLTFDTMDTSARGALVDQYLVDRWRLIGIDVQVAATNYNQFQEKVRKGAYQIFEWGWIADYPDPENFMFLLWSEMRRSRNEGPNSANFSDPRFDALFVKMKSRDNDAERLRLIREMRALLEEERPWIETFHREDYVLFHGWLRGVKPTGLSFPTVKYRKLDLALRESRRVEWNEPITWPAYGLAAVAVAVVLPGVFTFFRERQ
ncbi:MAG: ABC transporter substrate-binding protein [Proteobacteria bacterium]|nr:ABC transporter substrate-binding protein [Pseudomonadota bacterium]